MKISVLILNYNVSYFLDLCLISVKAASKYHDVEIIVVDNASSDDSIAMLKTKHPEIKLIENSENSGYPKGNNIGFKAVTGDWLLVLNPDVIVPEDLFNQLLSKNYIHNQGITGCYLIDGCGQFLPESKRLTPTPWVAITKILGLYVLFPKNQWFNQYYAMDIPKNEDGDVDILVGAFMWMKTSLYQQLDGFDENCFMYADDIDLSYRSKMSGMQNKYLANIKVLHFKGESTSRNQIYIKRFNEAMRYFYNKHFKKSYIFGSFMFVISYLFSIKKAFEKPIKTKQTNQFYIFPENKKLTEVLEKKLGKKILPLNNLNLSFESQTCIIFDQSQLTFKTILEHMQQWSGRNITFRIIPQNRSYIIGSDSKNGKGEVVNF
jgi:GT2 family glycosyltransferase